MKKLLLIAILMLTLVFTAVACNDGTTEETTVGDTTIEATTEEPSAEATEEPSAEATEEPSAEATEEPSTEVTEDASADVTVEDTAEATDAATTEEAVVETTEVPAPETTEEPETTEVPQIPDDFEEPTFSGNVSNLSICADNVRLWVGSTCTDLCTQEGHLYMANVDGYVDITGMDYISFRGWVNPTAGGIEIDQFGYQIGNNEPVFSADFWKDEPELNMALNSTLAKRYDNIMIPVADLEVGVTPIYLLVRDTNGTIYCMNGNWHGDLRVVKTA